MRGPALLIGLVLAAPLYAERQPLPPVIDMSGGRYGPGGAAAQPAASSQALYEMLGRIEQLQREVQQLRGMVEEQAYTVETLKKSQKDMYLDLDQRIRQVETPAAPAPSGGDTEPALDEGLQPPPQPSSDTGAAAPASAVPQSTPEAKAAYQKAYETLQTGNYNDAIGLFNAFLSAYPNDRYADNAQYWLGEAYYVTRNFGAAREAFNKVLKNFPKSQKVPDAMLKLGYIDYEEARWQDARRAMSDIIKDYPESTAASLAEKRLVRMNQENR